MFIHTSLGTPFVTSLAGRTRGVSEDFLADSEYPRSVKARKSHVGLSAGSLAEGNIVGESQSERSFLRSQVPFRRFTTFFKTYLKKGRLNTGRLLFIMYLTSKINILFIIFLMNYKNKRIFLSTIKQLNPKS
jgi:hypothetical protein